MQQASCKIWPYCINLSGMKLVRISICAGMTAKWRNNQRAKISGVSETFFQQWSGRPKFYKMIASTRYEVKPISEKSSNYYRLTHCGLVTPHSDRDQDLHWFNWTNVDLSSARSSDIHRRAIASHVPRPPITNISLGVTHVKSHASIHN